jgi:hypothetical protein
MRRIAVLAIAMCCLYALTVYGSSEQPGTRIAATSATSRQPRTQIRATPATLGQISATLPTEAEKTRQLAQTRNALQRYQHLWQQQQITDYQFQLTRRCMMCQAEYAHTVLIDVRNGRATLMISVTRKQKITGGYVEQENTVEKLFTIIHEAIEGQADRIVVDYEPILSYPTFIRIDRNQATFDDEIEYSIRLTAICNEVLIQPEC